MVKLTLLCKQKALYVKACIIQNGVADFHNDVLDTTDIKKIFTSFNNQDNFEIYHEEIPIQEVSLMENYISKTDEQIGSTTVPAGSWMATIRVDNPTIKQKLLNGDFGGVSLNNRVKTSCSTNLVGNITYSDLRDAECVIPIYISFVEDPANMVGLHIMDYDVYIHKSKNENENGGKEMSLLEDLKALINKAEEEVEETPAEDPVEEEIQKEATEEATEEESEEVAVEEEVAEEEIQKEADATEGVEATEEATEEPVIEKSEETESEEGTEIQKEAEEIIEEVVEEATEFNVEAEIQTLKEELANLKAIVEEMIPKNPIDAEVEVVEDNANEPIITKSAKIEVTEEAVNPVADFYERTGRDAITGMKIRHKSRILN